MNIDDLTLGQIKELMSMFRKPKRNSSIDTTDDKRVSVSINNHHDMVGKKVLVPINEYQAWFGSLYERVDGGVTLTKARLLHTWEAKKGIGLASCALDGIDYSESDVTGIVQSVWLNPVEIIPCTSHAIENLMNAPICEDGPNLCK